MVSSKPAEVHRMGSGKSSPDSGRPRRRAASCSSGRRARYRGGSVVRARAAMKLPIKVLGVARLGDTSHLEVEG